MKKSEPTKSRVQHFNLLLLLLSWTFPAFFSFAICIKFTVNFTISTIATTGIEWLLLKLEATSLSDQDSTMLSVFHSPLKNWLVLKTVCIHRVAFKLIQMS